MIPKFPSSIRHYLLDIEGTTSSIRFVTDVMFPFARSNIAAFLLDNWNSPQLSAALNLLAADLGQTNQKCWLGEFPSPGKAQEVICDAVFRLMDIDSKATGLKELQGLIWKRGFESGELNAHLFPDVLPAMRRWVAAGRQVWIYSSGSIAAQKLFFGHTTEGNLLSLISGHFDTTSGPKKEVSSYQKIISAVGCTADEMLFLSDVVPELTAARQAGLYVALSNRPDNPPQPPSATIPIFESFAQISMEIGETV